MTKGPAQAEALDRIGRAQDNIWRRFLLAECLQAYSDLDPTEWEHLQALLITDKYKEAKTMTLTYYERGIIQGKLEGEQEGKVLGERQALQRTAIRQLETKFGSLSAPAKERLEALSIAQLDNLVVALLRASSLKELGLED